MSSRSLAAAVLATALAAAGGSAARAETRQETFDAGNAAYQRADFAGAAEAYRRLAGVGVRDVRVEYNLGNAELKLGHLGSAILHYERAQRLDPADGDVRANLEFARSQAKDRVDDGDAAGPLTILRRAQDRAGVEQQALLALALWWAFAGIATWVLARPGRFTPAAGWVLAALAAAGTIAGASGYATWSRTYGTPRAVVLRPAVDVLAGPAENNAALFTIHEGTTVEVRGDREGWLQVVLPNGLNGWMPQDAAGRI